MKKTIVFIVSSIALVCLSSASIAKASVNTDLVNSNISTTQGLSDSFQLAHSAWGRHTWCERNPRQCAREKGWCARHPRECHGDRLYAHPTHHHHRHHRHHHRH